MSENEHWEARLRSWTPRRPSAEISACLFGQPANETWAGWNCSYFSRWVAPVAACFLSLLVVLQGSGRSSLHSSEGDSDSCFATVMFGASSNTSQQHFALSKNDENLEWNVWPHASFPITNGSACFSTTAAPATLTHP